MLDRSKPNRNPNPSTPQPKPAPPPQQIPDTYEALEEAGKSGGLFGRMNQAFQEALHTSRGPGRTRDAVEEAGDSPSVTADDLAIRRARNVKLQRMVVPEGVIIEGNMTSGSETEIAGKIEGNVTVEGRLYLAPSALVSGNVRATSCRVDGLVEGRVECTQELELGKTGRLSADALGGKEVIIGGQIFGDVSTGGVARLLATAKVNGNIRTRRVVIEEGALFNGSCTMRTPAQRSEKQPEKPQHDSAGS
ncbi:MAG: polymer-forming cytoskeletal protein [Candidatus Hydrogenedentes bacterium]|nr:polymer-forming cytoskeletal protein [Candidatus Hydrogenedentota bacterium]